MRTVLAFAVVACLTATPAIGQEPVASDGFEDGFGSFVVSNPESELPEIERLMGIGSLDLSEKAAADSFKGTLIGVVAFVAPVDALPDGTPVRVVIARVGGQELVALCAGGPAVAACGRLRTGRKATLTGFMSPFDDACGGEGNGIAEVYGFIVTKAVGR